MYPLRHVTRLVLEAAGVTGDFTVDLKVDDAVQSLALVVQRPDLDALGLGNVDILRNGASVGVTAFAGNSLVVPVYPFVFGADTEINFLHPANANPMKVDEEWVYDAVAAAYVKRTPVASAAGLRTSVKVTNLDATQKELILIWTGMIWRNT